MGGSNETTVGGLRCHINNGEVHIHDDTKSLKFKADSVSFKTDVEDALTQLSKTDGIVKIDGTSKESLCLVQDGKNFFMFVTTDKGMKTDLKAFLKSC